ncbi:MAG TPA: UDP-N-acetylmuramate--L-alanine ligase [Acidimicrobiales bacterium]|nr:UDP-N-acetylmuramate--L-alanine ligase [Acidimicrobiales bacterium]
MTLADRRAIHVVGAGGAGMSAIATILASMGKRVSGSDLKDSAALRRLEGVGVDIHVGHRAANVADVDAVAISTAVAWSNPEVAVARERGIPVLRRAELLREICAERPTVAVAGTHGKTTTTSMLALVLVEAGMHPSFLVGGDLNEVGGGAVWDAAHADAPFVVEADESDGTFLELGARDALVTSLEPDHLDHWGSFEGLVDAFERFLRAAPGTRLVSIDDPAGAALAGRTGAVTVGGDPAARWSMRDVVTGREGTRFTVVHDGAAVGRVELAVPGLHNARNALSATAMACELGAPVAAAEAALQRYAGVARRWQYRGEQGGVTFVDDYAHLPTEVAAAIDTGRRGGWARVVAVFQPHRYTRTAALWRSFADAFDGADVLVVTDVYPAGEAPRPGVTGKLVVDAVLDAHPAARVAWMPAHRDVIAYLTRTLRPGDLCLTLGAGDLTAVPDEVIAALGTAA